MKIRDQIHAVGGPAAYARLTDVPFRTAQNWHREGEPDGRTPPKWLHSIMHDALRYRHHLPK